MRHFTDKELIGSPGEGKCPDCKWWNNSVVVKTCGCTLTAQGKLNGTAEILEHYDIVILARDAKRRLEQRAEGNA